MTHQESFGGCSLYTSSLFEWLGVSGVRLPRVWGTRGPALSSPGLEGSLSGALRLSRSVSRKDWGS